MARPPVHHMSRPTVAEMKSGARTGPKICPWRASKAMPYATTSSAMEKKISATNASVAAMSPMEQAAKRNDSELMRSKMSAPRMPPVNCAAVYMSPRTKGVWPVHTVAHVISELMWPPEGAAKQMM